MEYGEIVRRRQALDVPEKYRSRYTTLGAVGLDGPWVTPLQKTSRSRCGVVLVAQDYLDTERARRNKPSILRDGGYCPGTNFKAVLFGALDLAELQPEDVYVTQALHLLPYTCIKTYAGTWKKQKVRHNIELVNYSFKRVTMHELVDRTVIAMGKVAAKACRDSGFTVAGHTSHPSRRRVPREVLIREIGTEIRRVLGMPSL